MPPGTGYSAGRLGLKSEQALGWRHRAGVIGVEARVEDRFLKPSALSVKSPCRLVWWMLGPQLVG
jgi:hypothetical protein